MVIISAFAALSLVLVHLITASPPCNGSPINARPEGVTVGNPPPDSDVSEKRLADWLSVNGGLGSIASMIQLLRSDEIHSTLIDIGKRHEDLLRLLYRYHMFTDVPSTPPSSVRRKGQLSVDMPLSAISDMLSNERMRNSQRRVHSQLLNIGKRDLHSSTLQ